MRFKGILLDLDNTLYEYDPAHAAGLEAALTCLAEQVGSDRTMLEQTFNEARRQIHGELNGVAASHNRLLYFQRMLELSGLNGLDHALEAYNRYWDSFLERMTLADGAREFLERSRESAICLVSDLTAHIQHRKIMKFGIAPFLHALVTSEEAGREKPHPAIFSLALRKLGLAAADVCMIGDNYQKDMVGAVNLGIHSFWLNRDGVNEPQSALITEFRTFGELSGYIHD